MYETGNINFGLIIVIILVLTVYTLLLVRFFLKRISDAEKRNIIAQQLAELNKLRFQAYERFTLLLERLYPESLVLREQNPKLPGYAFHAHLLKVIRQEFNHNLAMQIYISTETYEKIKEAKDKLILLINTSLSKIKPESSAFEFGKIIIENAPRDTNLYIKVAINALRKELEDFYKF